MGVILIVTENQLKEILYTFKSLQVQKELLQEYTYLDVVLDNKSEYKNEFIQWDIIIGSLTVLNEKEQFVIENHLINQKTWSKTVQLFDKQWGIEDGRSERTLMRIQQRALKKMTEFINRFKIEGHASVNITFPGSGF